jgi:hypothetical protein
MSTVSRVAYQVNILKSQLNGATAAFKVFRAQQDIEAAAKRNKSAAEESSGGGAGDGPAASSEQRCDYISPYFSTALLSLHPMLRKRGCVSIRCVNAMHVEKLGTTPKVLYPQPLLVLSMQLKCAS